MGRHSRRGPAPKSGAGGSDAGAAASPSGAATPSGAGAAPASAAPGTGSRRAAPVPPGRTPGARPAEPAPFGYGGPGGAPGQGAPRSADRTPASGMPRFPDGTPAHGVPRVPGGGFPDGTPARGVPRLPDGTPAHGFPRVPGGGFPDGTPARGVPRLPDGTPAHGVPRVPRAGFPQGAPAQGAPRLPDGTPARGGASPTGGPQVRGGHPEQRENGGGWGELRSGGVGAGPGRAPGVPGFPRQRQAPPGAPRQEYLDAFGPDAADDVFTPPRAQGSAPTGEPYASVTDWDASTASTGTADEDDAPPTGAPVRTKGGKGRTFTGIAAAAVTTVLAVVVAGQVTGGQDDTAHSASATDQARDARDPASRGDGRPSPSSSPSPVVLTYDQQMDRTYPLSATLKGSGRFEAVPGIAKAPGGGQKYTYRVDIEQGLGLDGELFAQAVQKTLNDDRSWAHGGGRTFERVYSGKPDFVITLASPGTTAVWCAKSGLDTTEDNVSCDSAATERVMINAYRWAQGSPTYGDQIHAYRQMLINHEVGHRLGYGHVTCDKNGELAPVMQQQTKFLDHDGIHCLPNPWPFPGN
ncbi:DUF3152 domain-containing protein [Streptomyces griseosporeus]|uniref:DUF3152 domain-containing protein n=1 Tax=Streptomyces griseosporeus TaxID=1910 RepID=UPI0037024EB7